MSNELFKPPLGSSNFLFWKQMFPIMLYQKNCIENEYFLEKPYSTILCILDKGPHHQFIRISNNKKINPIRAQFNYSFDSEANIYV
jgi:hypothetical protein